MLTVFLRTLIIYLLLLIAMRLVGKRQIGELQLSELITTLMLSELAVLPIGDADVPLSYAIVPILILLSAEIIVSFCASRCLPLRKLLFGRPSILIYRGRLNAKEMARLRMDVNELISELRLKDVADIAEVRCAILEDNGKLSVFKNAASSPFTPNTLTDTAEHGVSLPVLVSGKIVKSAMQHAGVDEAWIDARLRQHKLRRRDVLLMSVDEQKKTVYILKDAPGGAITEVEEQ